MKLLRKFSAGIALLGLGLSLTSAPAATANSVAWNSPSLDVAGVLNDATTSSSNASSVTYTVEVPSGGTPSGMNMQFYGFLNPFSGGGSQTVTQVSATSVQVAQGGFTVTVSVSSGSLSGNDVSAMWSVGVCQGCQDHVVVFVNQTRSAGTVVSFVYGTGSLTKDPNATNVRAGVYTSQAQFVSTRSYRGGSNSIAPRAGTAAAPIKYSGPEFSELSLKPALAGSSATLEGRKLDQISSVTIGGKAAVLSNASDKSVNIGLPAGLAPGVYDLVVTTASHGKLTHMNAIRIREELVPTSLTIQGTGVLSGEEFKKLTAFARTQSPDMNTVTCIVNSGSEGKSFTQARALCDRIAAANPNIKTTQFEVRSTVKSSAVFARAVFSSMQ